MQYTQGADSGSNNRYSFEGLSISQVNSMSPNSVNDSNLQAIKNTTYINQTSIYAIKHFIEETHPEKMQNVAAEIREAITSTGNKRFNDPKYLAILDDVDECSRKAAAMINRLKELDVAVACATFNTKLQALHQAAREFEKKKNAPDVHAVTDGPMH